MRRRWPFALPMVLPAIGVMAAMVQPATSTSSSCSLPVSTVSSGGTRVTASEFGGPGDPGTGSTGYRGDNLYQHPDSFAELGMGTALGNLPYMTPITVSYNGRSITVYKRDIGAGGPGLGGTVRAVDLWFQAAQQLGLNGLAIVTVQVGKVGAPAGGICQTASVGGATDPAPGATWSRLDMGFDGDYSMSAGAVAPYDGVVHCCMSGWPGQGVYFWVVNNDQSGPDYTRAMYFAEGATPIVPDGAHVTAGQPIGRPVRSGGDGQPGNFEIGPAQANGDCLAKQYGTGSSGARQMVLAFYNWMRSLGAGVTTNPTMAGAP